MPPCRVACHRLRWVRWECDVWTPLRSQSCRTFLRHRRYFKQQRKTVSSVPVESLPDENKGKKKKKECSWENFFQEGIPSKLRASNARLAPGLKASTVFHFHRPVDDDAPQKPTEGGELSFRLKLKEQLKIIKGI